MRANQSNDAEELASLEQRAREHAVTLERALHWSSTSKTFAAALRAGIAALSAQPRETAPRWVEVMCRQCGRPTMHMGSLCFSCSKASRGGAEAAPQPREVRGVDAVRALVAEWRQRPGITDAYKICATELETALATTPQDAADVEGAAVYLMQSDFGLWKEQTKAEHEWWEGRQSAPLRRVLYTTPPPGVDVAALRQIAGELRDNAHHHQQEDRAVGIFADEQEAQFNTELAQRIERALAGDAAAPGTGKNS